MEAELQSCWAGEGTRSRAEESAVGNWKMLGKLSADGRSKMLRKRAPLRRKTGRHGPSRHSLRI